MRDRRRAQRAATPATTATYVAAELRARRGFQSTGAIGRHARAIETLVELSSAERELRRAGSPAAPVRNSEQHHRAQVSHVNKCPSARACDAEPHRVRVMHRPWQAAQRPNKLAAAESHPWGHQDSAIAPCRGRGDPLTPKIHCHDRRGD